MLQCTKYPFVRRLKQDLSIVVLHFLPGVSGAIDAHPFLEIPKIDWRHRCTQFGRLQLIFGAIDAHRKTESS